MFSKLFGFSINPMPGLSILCKFPLQLHSIGKLSPCYFLQSEKYMKRIGQKWLTRPPVSCSVLGSAHTHSHRKPCTRILCSVTWPPSPQCPERVMVKANSHRPFCFCLCSLTEEINHALDADAGVDSTSKMRDITLEETAPSL